MDINTTIVAKTQGIIINYDLRLDNLNTFLALESGSEAKREKSIKLIQNIMTAHGKKSLYKYVLELSNIENGGRDLQYWIRDHVLHAIHCFILGIYLNENYLNQYGALKVDSFQMKLAILFHDVGYPVEISQNLLLDYNLKISEIAKEIDISIEKQPIFKVSYDKLNVLYHNKSLDLIQEQLNKWELKINAKREFNKRKKEGKVCHGIISSLLLLKVIDLMYEKYNPFRVRNDIYESSEQINWNQSYFEKDVVPACTAIFIHNLDASSFNKTKINPQKAPLAFLLKLTDILQEWERPKSGLENGLSAEKFDIYFQNNQLSLIADIDEGTIKKMNDEIQSFLLVDNILVVKKT